MKIAILEDEEKHQKLLQEGLLRYGSEHNCLLDIRVFTNAVSFLETYSTDYEAVFIDVKMPYINGMDAAHMLREKDEKVAIIFVTSLVQYAVEGYSVNAFDYLVKPFSYEALAMTMTRLLRYLPNGETHMLLPMLEGNIRVAPSQIVYLETNGHQVIYHLLNKTYTRYTSFKTACQELKDKGFSECNRCYCVNLHFVRSIKGYTVDVNGEQLQISQPKKKRFLADVSAFQGKE